MHSHSFTLFQGSRRLAAGDLSSRIAPKLAAGEDEANALARDLDMMAERIAGLLRAQQQLMRDVSHELRSPLARLSVALELARDASESERAELHDRIAKEAARLEQLIGEVLTLTRLEGGAPEARSGDRRARLVGGDDRDPRRSNDQDHAAQHRHSNRGAANEPATPAPRAPEDGDPEQHEDDAGEAPEHRGDVVA